MSELSEIADTIEAKWIAYEDLKHELEIAPRTWLPALLKALVEVSIQKNVFLTGEVNKFVASVEKQTNPPNEKS